MNNLIPFKILLLISIFFTFNGPLYAVDADANRENAIQRTSEPHIALAENNAHGPSMNLILERLERQGYYGLSVHDGKLPGLAVKACKNGKTLLLGVNRWGDILWQQPRGTC